MRITTTLLPILALIAGLTYVSLPAAPDAAAGVEPAPAAAPALEVSWRPDAPRQGTLFTVHATEPGGLDVRPSGTFAGEPLHFDRDESGGWWAIAAMPVDAEGAQPLVVEAGPAFARAHHEATVAAAPGEYRMERLTVAPRFSESDPEIDARTERESQRAMAVAVGAHETPRMWSLDALVRPRPGRVTSGFGNGREFNGVVQSRHSGTDFAGAVGEPVVAAADGIVGLVDQFFLGGGVVYIDHGGGLSTAYLHLSEQHVEAGDTVRAGDRIGSVGATGRVTGPHLHWIVRYGGLSVDPLSFLALVEGG